MLNKKSISFIVIIVVVLVSIWTVTVMAENEDDLTGDVKIVAENTEAEGNDDEQTDEPEGDAENNAADDVIEEEEEVVDDVSLPESDDFVKVTENEGFILRADPETGHFAVENKETGHLFKSYPNPDKWDEDLTADSWKSHLKAPFMFSYVEMNERRDQVKESNLFNNESEISFEEIEGGYRVTYEMPDLGFIFPIEVQLEKDYVETRILADDIIDEKELSEEEEEEDRMARLVSLRLFPFLGADNSDDSDGFLFLPDGSGALVEFQEDRASTTNLYSERIYGDDQAFAEKASLSSRLPIRMPIFGIKSDDQAILGVVHEGDTYTNIVSAPSESFSQYNWVTGEHLFRFKVYQATNKQKTEGFYTYSKDMQRTNRSIRYYMIDKANPDYVDLATRYREYLIDEEGLEKQEYESDSLQLSLNILGGGTKSGFLWDSYLPLTTIDQAMSIVQDLGSLGVDDMSITFHGWQRNGYGEFGGHFPVAKKLGGNKSMKEFTDFAHSKGYPVYLDGSSYTYNNTGKDGFRASRDGLRDLSSNVMRFRKKQNDTVLVSPRFMEDVIYDDLSTAEKLGIDGYLFGEGIGSILPSDYNERYLAERHEVKDIQRDILQKTKETFGDVRIAEGNVYSFADSSHIEQLDNDYSYDLFVDETVPFAQIALHGLISYSFDYGNMSGNAQESLLKGIEYGAVPSFLVTHEESHRLLELKSMYQFYSTYYKDWESEIVTYYQLFNEALADVQDQFIVNHEKLAKNVFETEYENGKRIIVNYNSEPFTHDEGVIDAEDYMIIQGGE